MSTCKTCMFYRNGRCQNERFPVVFSDVPEDFGCVLYREKVQKILRNRCMCANCGDIIESKSVHDFVQCKCGEIFTDGGTDYIHHGANKFSDIIDMTEYEDIGELG